MANDEHLAKLKEGVQAWNAWRLSNPGIRPDLSKADLGGEDYSYLEQTGEVHGQGVPEEEVVGPDFHEADLNQAKLIDADLRCANFDEADLKEADLSGATLLHASLTGANLSKANMKGVDLRKANLLNATLTGANLSRADLRGDNRTWFADGLTQAQIDSAQVFKDTKLPEGIQNPATNKKEARNPHEPRKVEAFKSQLDALEQTNADLKRRLAEEHQRIDEMVENAATSEESAAKVLTDIKEAYAKQEKAALEVQREASDLVLQLKKESKNLKESYAAQLQLEAPAMLWETQAVLYGKQASTWSLRAVLASLLFVGILLLMLVYLQDIFFPMNMSGLTGAQITIRSLRSILLVGTFVSVGAYLIGILVRLAMSAYHLERDASERRQLTLFYIALLKEAGGTSEQDREIILQSLFSRAETGLLRKDGGPTMPSGHLAKLASPGKPTS